MSKQALMRLQFEMRLVGNSRFSDLTSTPLDDVTLLAFADRLSKIIAEPPSEVTDEMVNRFLCWRLPDDFVPDAGIRFTYNSMPHEDNWPVGTNLLTATQAKAMLEYVLGVKS